VVSELYKRIYAIISPGVFTNLSNFARFLFFINIFPYTLQVESHCFKLHWHLKWQ